MKWKKFTIDTTTEAVDLVSDMLSEIGIQGIEIEDNVPLTENETKGMFIDILPELPPDDGTAKVSFYLSADEDTKNATFQCGDAPRQAEEPELPENACLDLVLLGAFPPVDVPDSVRCVQCGIQNRSPHIRLAK